MLSFRDRGTATGSPNPPTSSVSADPEGRVSSVTASCASEGVLKTVLDNSLLHHSDESCMLHIEIHVNCSLEALYPADNPPWVMLYNTSRKRFAGVHNGYNSNIVVSSSRDLVYFDRIPPITKGGYLEVFNAGDRNPSNMAFIAINLHEVTSTSFDSLYCRVYKDALLGLFLVVTDDSICDLIRDTKADEWGFREIDQADLRARWPQLYANGLNLVKTFKTILGGVQRLDYKFVFDWDRLGME
ncbi:hypothetical protein EV127DRAFT_410226 [Xylaria flabelliformis]|nr:hypothetical protein EV127DRAFT_410226 [Xylaria flabelliformis]